MRVVSGDNFSIYVYPDDHAPPHCHVRFKGGEEVRITIPTLTVMDNRGINKGVRAALRDNMDAICEAWDLLNPIEDEQKKENIK